MKEKKQKQEVKKEKIKSNPRIDKIVKDFPKQLHAFPRASFEEQLKEHLIKHEIN